MPFGLQGAPATFQSLMDFVLAGMGDYAAVYMDDVVLLSTTWVDHVHHIRQVLWIDRRRQKVPLWHAAVHLLAPRGGNGLPEA